MRPRRSLSLGVSAGARAISRKPSIVTQFKALGRRALLNAARDPYLGALHLILTPMVGLVVGLMFQDLRRLNEETAGVQASLLSEGTDTRQVQNFVCFDRGTRRVQVRDVEGGYGTWKTLGAMVYVL